MKKFCECLRKRKMMIINFNSNSNLTQKRSKLEPWNFAAHSNSSFEISAPSLVSLVCFSLHILDKIQTGVFRVSAFLASPKKNCHKSRTSNDIDMKTGPVTKLDKGNKATSKKLMMIHCQQILNSLSLLRFMTKLKQSGCQIPDA